MSKLENNVVETNYNKQLEEALNFVEDTPYINEVLNGALSVDKLDANSLYELVYLKQKLNVWIRDGISNKDTFTAVKTLYDKLSNILETMSDDLVDSILSSKLNRARANKVNIKKYKANTLNDVKKLANPISVGNNPIKLYFCKIMPKLIIILVMGFILISGAPAKLISAISENADSTSRFYLLYVSMMRFLINVGTIVVLMLSSASLCIDIMYLAFPKFRELHDKCKEQGLAFALASTLAKEAVEEAEYLPNINIYNNADVLNKVELSNTLLSNLHLIINKFNTEVNDYIKNNEYLERKYVNADYLLSIIETIESNLAKSNSLTKLVLLADAELIYTDMYDIVTPLSEKIIEEEEDKGKWVMNLTTK